MPIIEFEDDRGHVVACDRPERVRLIDVCDELGAPVPFSCRSATCGTCRVDVLEGGALLDPPAADELEVLGLFGDTPARTRLACRAHAREGSGRVRLRTVGESR